LAKPNNVSVPQEEKKPLKTSTINIAKDDIPQMDGADGDVMFPSTVTNNLLPPNMVQQARALGIKEMTIQDLEGTPQHYQNFNKGNWHDKCMIHGQWLQYQINYFESEKAKGKYYPALGDYDTWERNKKSAAQGKSLVFDENLTFNRQYGLPRPTKKARSKFGSMGNGRGR
jgi:hypothetical protein